MFSFARVSLNEWNLLPNNPDSLERLLGDLMQVLQRYQTRGSLPVAVDKWRTRLLTVREVSRSNPSNLPLLQTWHVGNVTSCHAVYTLIQCTPLLVEKAGVTPDVTFRITACKQERVQARYPLWIWNPWGRTHEVQNRSNQWLHKMDLGPDKNFKKKTKKNTRGSRDEWNNHSLQRWTADGQDVQRLAQDLCSSPFRVCRAGLFQHQVHQA